MIVKDLLHRARHTLSDLTANRWTDERLLILLNEGLNDIAKNTILFVKTGYISLASQQTEYDLSSFATKILRIEYLDEPLAYFSHSEMDKKDSAWQQREGSYLKAYILDKQKEACIKLYPKLINSNSSVIDFGSSFGIITGLTYSDLPIELSETFGDLGEVDAKDFIKVYYIERPVELTSILDELELSTVIQEAVTHYIAARAFRDNIDAQSRSMGSEELNLYTNQLAAYVLEKAKSFSQSGYTVPYNPSGV